VLLCVDKGEKFILIGVALIAVHLVGILLTGTSVNPARSIGPAIVAMFNNDFEPIKQV
jgi:aquaporin Z